MKNKVIEFLESSNFGTILLILATMLEAFYSYNLFRVTGTHTFAYQTIIVSIIYSSIIAGTIVFFALRNNLLMVWAAVIFEFLMNLLLDIQTVALASNINNKIWVFISQLAIGTILPLATKAFAEEINKKYIKTRNTYEK
jgi:hypothetical protein